jgi:hypothetical protein
MVRAWWKERAAQQKDTHGERIWMEGTAFTGERLASKEGFSPEKNLRGEGINAQKGYACRGGTEE